MEHDMSFELAESQPLRVVPAVDDAQPAGGADGFAEITQGRAIDMLHKLSVDLYITLSGTEPTATVIPFWWDNATQLWHADPAQAVSITGTFAFVCRVNARGRYCQPRVTALGGTGSPSVTVRYIYPIFYGI